MNMYLSFKAILKYKFYFKLCFCCSGFYKKNNLNYKSKFKLKVLFKNNKLRFIDYLIFCFFAKYSLVLFICNKVPNPNIFRGTKDIIQ